MNWKHWIGLGMILGGGALAKLGSTLLKPVITAYGEVVKSELEEKLDAKKEVDE